MNAREEWGSRKTTITKILLVTLYFMGLRYLKLTVQMHRSFDCW